MLNLDILNDTLRPHPLLIITTLFQAFGQRNNGDLERVGFYYIQLL